MNNKIKKICHISDIHIRKSPARHEEYRYVFNNLYKSLKEKKPNRIVITGDLNDNYITMEGEQLTLAREFLINLAKFAPVRITRGNHDYYRANKNRMDCVQAIVNTLPDDLDVIYYNKTGFFHDENVTWAVWHHGEKKSPWAKRKKDIIEGNKIINLFHDPIRGTKSATGYEFKNINYVALKDFKEGLVYAGDIHKQQWFYNKNSDFVNEDNENIFGGYASSIISQNFGEGDDDFHGYLLWDLENKKVEKINIENDWSYKNIILNPYTDFKDLDIEIENPTKYMNIRFLWQTLPAAKTKENIHIVTSHLKTKYENQILSIKHKNEFLEEEKYEIIDDEKLDVNDIQDQTTQHEIFKKHLERIGVDDNIIKEVIKLDDEITSRIDIDEFTNIEWDIVKFGGKNFMSYEDINIDWRNDDGIYQISGLNQVGKTTILKLISYILYNKAPETESREKNGDSRYVNNKNGASFCDGHMVLEIDHKYYGLYRKTNIEYNKEGEIKSSPTTLEYYILNNIDDEFSDENSINVLSEKDRFLTQEKLNRAIGSYDNFMRVILTTSDTLNLILSSNKSDFTDSLLFDSGLDIFDRKLTTFKEYEKDELKKPRVNCNLERTENEIKELEEKIENLKTEIDEIDRKELPIIDESILKGKNYVESLIKKIYKIDDEIYNLDVEQVKKQIDIYEKSKSDYQDRLKKINKGISELRESFDVEKLNTLIEEKDKNIALINELKLEIKEEEQKINDEKHNKAILNGQILQLKKEGENCKEEIIKLKKSKICPTCGGKMTKKHDEHVNLKIKEIEREMYEVIAPQIKTKNLNIPEIDNKIESITNEISLLKNNIDALNEDGLSIIEMIGKLNIQKQDVDKRKELQNQGNEIPLKCENINLNIKLLNDKLILHSNMEKQIDENHKIDIQIKKAKDRIDELEFERKKISDLVYNKKTIISQSDSKINELNDLIKDYIEQEKQDEIRSIYKKCVHRDGIPQQILKTHVIPKINDELNKLLNNLNFDVWLDEEELKLKFSENIKIDAIINAISGSGKERTFSAIGLKHALNRRNAKSKPTILLLDEICGKLTKESVDEFMQLLNEMKIFYKKILIIEHNHQMNPDYNIDVTRDERGISHLTIE